MGIMYKLPSKLSSFIVSCPNNNFSLLFISESIIKITLDGFLSIRLIYKVYFFPFESLMVGIGNVKVLLL